MFRSEKKTEMYANFVIFIFTSKRWQCTTIKKLKKNVMLDLAILQIELCWCEWAYLPEQICVLFDKVYFIMKGTFAVKGKEVTSVK